MGKGLAWTVAVKAEPAKKAAKAARKKVFELIMAVLPSGEGLIRPRCPLVASARKQVQKVFRHFFASPFGRLGAKRAKANHS
jgi:hypothetical protein